MGVQVISAEQPGRERLTITVTLGRKPKTVSLGSWTSAALVLTACVLGLWCLGATLYLVFHDRLLAGLLARQTEVQYAYEDRIAGLSLELDRQTSRALVDRHTLETSVRDLEERSLRLASRAALIDQLVARGGPGAKPSLSAFNPLAPKTSSDGSGTANPLLADHAPAATPAGVHAYVATEAPPARSAVTFDVPPLRLREDGDAASQRRSDLDGAPASLDDVSRTVAATLSTIENDQARTLTTLREPALRTIAKLRTALLDVGVPVRFGSVTAAGADLGGPFVPLVDAKLTFEQKAELLRETLLQADRLMALVDRVPLRQPSQGPLEVTSAFGPRIDPFLGRAALHTGVDLREPYGAEVHATAGGTVTVAAVEGGYGTMVEVDHGNGLVTRYAHLSNASVSPGQSVDVGDVVGHVGSSGRATGPHLHYEVRVNGDPVDPTRFLKTGARVLAP